MRDKLNDTLKRIQDDYYTTGPPNKTITWETIAERYQALADRRLELLRDLVDAFEANCFLADQIPEETTAYILAKKELSNDSPHS